MNCSTETDKVFAAFYKFQQALKGLSLDSRSHHGKFMGFPLIAGKTKEAAADTGISISQELHFQPPNMVGCSTQIMHESGQWFDNGILFMPVSKPDPQSFGSFVSYLKRYSLSAAILAAIDLDDDCNKAMPDPINLSKKSVDLANIREDIPEVEGSAHNHGAWIPAQKSKQSAQMLFAACQTKEACEELKTKLLQKVLAIEDKVLADQKADELQKAFDDRMGQL